MIRKTAALLAVLIATGGVGACAPRCVPAPTGADTVTGVTGVTGADEPQPATGRRPPALTGFYGYTVVQPDDYLAYVTDSKVPFRAAVFATPAGIHCQLGPNTYEYRAGTVCWGPLPGVAAGIDTAVVTTEVSDAGTHRPVESGPIPADAVYSYLEHAGDPAGRESVLSGDGGQQRLAAADYHLLRPGQMLVVPGGRFSRAVNSVCALDADTTLTCEIQTADAPSAGFVLSAAGSRAY